MPSFKLIPIGSQFGRLTVCGDPIKRVGKMTKYPCQCSCGNQTFSIGAQLKNGTAKSCGCARKESLSRIKTTHGGSRTKLHMVWCGMKSRCSNPNHVSFRYYGAKGIKVVGSFLKYSQFRRWSLRNGYVEGLTLDRIKSSKNYCASNCRWVDYTVQNRNSGSVHPLTFGGSTMCLQEWAEKVGISAGTIRSRLKKGWSIERSLTKEKWKRLKIK